MRTAFLLSGLVGSTLLLAAPAGAGEEGWGFGRHRPYRGFEVEVLVDGRPLTQYVAGGSRYVEAREGAEYELRVTNPTPGRVAVALSVDGLNTIDARRTTAREASQWVILPYQSATIRGWQVSTERARRFTFTTRRDSYAARLGDSGDVGVISAVFFRERGPVPMRSLRAPSGWERSRDEASGAAEAPKASAGAEVTRGRDRSDRYDDDAATGMGRSVPYDVRSVSMALEDWPAAELTIRYAYRPELLRLGVLPRDDSPEPATPWHREPSFPADDRRFCPEP